jgi:hypothetical protein
LQSAQIYPHNRDKGKDFLRYKSPYLKLFCQFLKYIFEALLLFLQSEQYKVIGYCKLKQQGAQIDIAFGLGQETGLACWLNQLQSGNFSQRFQVGSFVKFNPYGLFLGM